ncbi:MAG: hypothetical protein ABF946_13185, partial [Acetobacter papayae]
TMLRAEQAMRQELAQTSLADLAHSVRDKAPPPFFEEARSWLDERAQNRRTGKVRQRRRAETIQPLPKSKSI